MEQPTKEEVLKIKTYIATWAFMPDQEILRKLCDAYLEQMEEQKKSEKEWVAQNALWIDGCKERDALKAENAGLKAEGNTAVQRFVRGGDKACLVCGKREPCVESPDACTFEPTPMELMKQVADLKAENAALKHRLSHPPITGGGDNFAPQVKTGINNQ